MNLLIILNEGPYNNEKTYNGLRTSLQILNQIPHSTVNIYLFSDSVGCAYKAQKPSAAKYNTGELISELLTKGAKIKLCKSCLEARGAVQLIDGVEISNLKELTEWIIGAEKSLTF